MSVVNVMALNTALSPNSVEKLAAAIVAGMILEAAYRGEETNAAEISAAIATNPEGETAGYFRHAVVGSLDLIATFRAHPDLMGLFGDPERLARVGGAK